jgi:hypothetical protein
MLFKRMFILPDIFDINYFINNSKNLGRSSNNHNNKIRENIILSMPFIDDEYFSDPKFGIQWTTFKYDFDKNMKIICSTFTTYKIKHKAGRKFNYDYLISFLDETNQIIYEEKLEFKYNAFTIDETPQFVSPMKPSQYLSIPFEEYYYDNYLVKLFQKFMLEIPNRENYLKTIHNNKPKCMEQAQLLYYQGCKQSSKYTASEQSILFYETCNVYSRECIKKFIENSDLDISKLTQYLINSQDKKIYLLYKDGKFNLDTTDIHNYHILSYSKNPEKARYEALTQSGKKINILLRWKNGNGIAYPAFQIS